MTIKNIESLQDNCVENYVRPPTLYSNKNINRNKNIHNFI